jgi:hypothetical protein
MGIRCLAREDALAPHGYQERTRQILAVDSVVSV